jgi:electron transfer flavoprotein alpha subunit
MIAVVVVRGGSLPAGGDETVAEAGGRAVLVGSGTSTAADSLAGIATEITVVERPTFQPSTLAAELAPLLAGEPHVLLPASPDGRDLAPHLAVLLHRQLYAAAALVTPHRVSLVRNDGAQLHEVVPTPEFVATLTPGLRGAADRPLLSCTRSEAQLAGGSGNDAQVLEVVPPDPASIDLSEATRIVCAGAGLDDPARLAQLARIGTAVGASVGATRVITDRGWMGHERQIGTTGVVVDPHLYLAFGVSGAVQHTSGLGDPDHTIAVNTDAHCPMMQLADLAVVADANAVLDHLEQLLGVRP